ncbi:hypothetical protein [Streptomyces sp. NPDC001404]
MTALASRLAASAHAAVPDLVAGGLVEIATKVLPSIIEKEGIRIA